MSFSRTTHGHEDDDAGFSLIAYRLRHAPKMRLVPGARRREWMDSTNQAYANRCLPLLIANQSGWFVLNDIPFKVSWNGSSKKSGLTVMYESGRPPYSATSMFGHGILTISIPFLFRTPPGVNLLARGPANWPKDGIAPLEGVIETDWAVSTFTMNWQMTRPDHVVSFDAGEPLCMVVPQRRGELESFHPRVGEITDVPELDDAHESWLVSRRRFLTELRMSEMRPPDAAKRMGWQKHYFRGTSPGGENAAEHQQKLVLRKFEE